MVYVGRPTHLLTGKDGVTPSLASCLGHLNSQAVWDSIAETFACPHISAHLFGACPPTHTLTCSADGPPLPFTPKACTPMGRRGHSDGGPEKCSQGLTRLLPTPPQGSILGTLPPKKELLISAQNLRASASSDKTIQ